MPVTICAFGQVAACFDPFFQAAADRNEAALLLAAIMEAILAIAIFGSVAFKAIVSVRFGSTGNFLLEMSFCEMLAETEQGPDHSVVLSDLALVRSAANGVPLYYFVRRLIWLTASSKVE